MKEKPRKRLAEVCKKFAMFSLSSGAGTIVDLGLHWFLSTRFFQESYWWSFWISPFISFQLSVLTNFLIAYYFVWRERISYRGTRSFWRHFAAYNATATGVFLIKLAAMQGIHLMFIALGWFQDASYEPVLCNLLSLCVSGGFNFVMNEFVIFKKVNKNNPDSKL